MTATLTERQLGQIESIASCRCYDEEQVEARLDYSGRFMYGATCVGFTGPMSAAALAGLLGVAFAEVLGTDNAAWLMAQAQVDDMGLGSIVYFPKVQVA